MEKQPYLLKDVTEGQTREEYNNDLAFCGFDECILNNALLYETLDNLNGIETLKEYQIKNIIHNTMVVFKDAFTELTKNAIFDFDSFVDFQNLICQLIVENVKKAIDNKNK